MSAVRIAGHSPPSRLSRVRYEVERRLLTIVNPPRVERHQDRCSIFLVPALSRRITGGVISIIDLLDASGRIGLGAGFDTRACLLPVEQYSAGVKEYRNSWILDPLASVIDDYRSADRLWIHVPEFAVSGAMASIAGALRNIDPDRVRINILNQNVRLMPSRETLDRLSDEFGLAMTCTTAHSAYCTPAERIRLGVPLHHFSTWVSPEHYAFAAHIEKLDQMVLSPDQPEMNDRLREAMAGARPQLDFTVVNNMPYDAYLSLVFKSRWSATFGEGLDGYFAEVALAGGVPFAVYNSEFFTPEYAELPNVFASQDDMLAEAPAIVSAARQDPDLYASISRATTDCLSSQYNYGSHLERMTAFYLDKLDHP